MILTCLPKLDLLAFCTWPLTERVRCSLLHPLVSGLFVLVTPSSPTLLSQPAPSLQIELAVASYRKAPGFLLFTALDQKKASPAILSITFYAVVYLCPSESFSSLFPGFLTKEALVIHFCISGCD